MKIKQFTLLNPLYFIYFNLKSLEGLNKSAETTTPNRAPGSGTLNICFIIIVVMRLYNNNCYKHVDKLSCNDRYRTCYVTLRS